MLGKDKEISNKKTVLSEINDSLNQSKNPAIEYILVRGFVQVPLLFGYGICFNNYGHSAVRYTRPDTGEDVVMNITDSPELVEFINTEDYFYGIQQNGQQEALYNREMITLRVENLPERNIIDMHNYYLSLMNQDKRFNICFGPVYNSIRKIMFFFNFKIFERGNCAKWTSEGLKRAKVVTNVSLFPKSVWINMYENHYKTDIGDIDNMNTIFYKRIRHASRSYGKDFNPIDGVAPLQGIRNILYNNLMLYCNRVVEVPQDSETAVVTKNIRHQPNKLRNVVNNKLFICGSAISTLVLSGIALRRRRMKAGRGLFTRRSFFKQ